MPAILKRLFLLALLAASQPTSVRADQPAGSPDLVIGALARPAGPGRWLLGGGNDRYVVTCSGKDCDGQLIDIEIRPGAGGECNEAMLAERALLGHPSAFGDPEFVTIARPGFTIKAVLIDMGCRNWTGSPVHACAAMSGDLYMFAADGGGCRNTPPRFHEPVLQFLDGLVLAQP